MDDVTFVKEVRLDHYTKKRPCPELSPTLSSKILKREKESATDGDTKKRPCPDSSNSSSKKLENQKEEIEKQICAAFKDWLPKEFKPEDINLDFKQKLENNATEKEMAGVKVTTRLGPLDYTFYFEFKIPGVVWVIGDGFVRIHRTLDTAKKPETDRGKKTHDEIEYHTTLDDSPSPHVSVSYKIYPEDDDEEILDSLTEVMNDSFANFITNSAFPEGELRELHDTVICTIEPFIQLEPALE